MGAFFFYHCGQPSLLSLCVFEPTGLTRRVAGFGAHPGRVEESTGWAPLFFSRTPVEPNKRRTIRCNVPSGLSVLADRDRRAADVSAGRRA